MTLPIVILLMLAAPKAAPNKWPIETIAVQGNRNIPTEKILAVAGLKVGQAAGKDDFDAARTRLVDTGMFDSVGYNFAPAPNSRGYRASFEVVEITPVYPVQFEGLSASTPEIETYLRAHDPLFGPLLPGTQQILEKYARQIEVFLASRNHPDKVIGKIIAVGPDQFRVLFRSETALPAIAEVTFDGNQAVPSTALQGAISGVAYGVPFSQDGFRGLLDSQIRPLYDAQGLIRVKFPKVTSEPSDKVKGVVVHVTVDEGPVYTLKQVSVAGQGDGPDLSQAAGVKTGEAANFGEVNNGAERVRKTMQRNGYMEAETRVERIVDDKAKTVNAIIHVTPGPQFHFAKLDVQGLDLSGEAAIRKLWSMKEGKPFDAAYPAYFLNRIKEDGLFDNLGDTRSTNQVNQEAKTVDVTLQFRYLPPPDEKKRRRPGGPY